MSVTRRVLLGSVLGLGLLPGTAFAEPVVLRAVRVDTSGIARRGLSNYARRIEAMAAPIAAQTFAGQVRPGTKGAPTLVVHIDEISLAASAAPESDGMFGMGPKDWISGSWELIGANGARIKGDTLQTQSASWVAAPWYAQNNEDLRAQRVIMLFLHWVQRAL